MDEAGEDRRLYKYLTAATAKAVLSTQTLRWSTPGTFNDPFDTQFDLHLSVDRQRVRDLAIAGIRRRFDDPVVGPAANQLGNLINYAKTREPPLTWAQFSKGFEESIIEGIDNGLHHLPELHRAVRTELGTSKILCLSELPDNLTMWAYYADAHKGAVFQLGCVPGLDSPYQTAKPVTYSKDMPQLCDENFLAQLYSGEVNFSPNEIVARTVYTKALGWSHEREWRIYSGDGRARGAAFEDVPFAPDELEAVYLGCRMSEEEQSELCRLLAKGYRNTAVYKMAMREKEFAIEAIALSSKISARP